MRRLWKEWTKRNEQTESMDRDLRFKDPKHDKLLFLKKTSEHFKFIKIKTKTKFLKATRDEHSKRVSALQLKFTTYLKIRLSKYK